jgi:amidophosphoribosyltransferase
MCGIFGIVNHPEASHLAYLGLYALQHRGQESTGIATADGEQVHLHKSMGHVADVYDEDVLAKLTGAAAIGHTRYSTAGDSSENNAQPLMVTMRPYGPMALCHNGNLINAVGLRSELEEQGAIFQSTSDSEVILHLMARSQEPDILEALKDAVRQIQGAFSILIITKDALIGARDANGFRPLCLGKLNGSYVMASETCAFDLIEAKYEREVEPGEIVMIRGEMLRSVQALPSTRTSKCVFEHVYFSRPDSMVFGRTVQNSRDKMGVLLAQESPVPADLVVPVPDSGVAAAIGYARESGIPFAFGLIRNHYVGRTFIEPRKAIRHFGVKVKLNPVRDLLRGKRVILIDDSLVRGTTSRKIVKMVRAAGATEVHMRITCPPTISPCYYGVDTPTRKELIASDHTLEEICTRIEADSLAYLSLPGLLQAVNSKPNEFCSACYTGKYPLEFADMMPDAKEAERQLDLWEESLKKTS